MPARNRVAKLRLKILQPRQLALGGRRAPIATHGQRPRQSLVQLDRLVPLVLWHLIPCQRTFPRLRQVCQECLSVFKPPFHPAPRDFKLPIHRQISKPPARYILALAAHHSSRRDRLQARVDRLSADSSGANNLDRKSTRLNSSHL